MANSLRLKALTFYVVMVLSLLSLVPAVASTYSFPTKGQVAIDSALIFNGNKMSPVEFDTLSAETDKWTRISNLSMGLPIDPRYSWFQFSITNPAEEPQSGYLVFPDSNIVDKATLYNSDGKAIPLLMRSQNMFGKVAAMPSQLISINARSTVTYFLVVESDKSGYVPLMLSAETYLKQQHVADVQIQHLVLGGLLLGLSVFILALFFNRTLIDGLVGLHFLALSASFMIWFALNNDINQSADGFLWFYVSFALIAFTWATTLFRVLRVNRVRKYASLTIYAIIVAIGPMLTDEGALTLLLVVGMSILAYLIFESFQASVSGKLTMAVLNTLALFGLSVVTMLHLAPEALPVSNQFAVILFYTLQAVLAFMVVLPPLWMQRQTNNLLVTQITELKNEKETIANEMSELREEAEEALETAIQERTLELNIALQELEEVNRELEKKNTTDELSGLYNRRFFDQRFLAEYRRSKRELTPLSLVLIDIDFFKKINDNYGHIAGDECIRQVGQTLKLQLKRSSDVACRYGGEEFCLILPHTEMSGAYAFADNLREVIANTEIHVENTQIEITISCGVVTYQQEDDVGLEQIFQKVDQALYQAKNSGRNNVQKAQLLTD